METPWELLGRGGGPSRTDTLRLAQAVYVSVPVAGVEFRGGRTLPRGAGSAPVALRWDAPARRWRRAHASACPLRLTGTARDLRIDPGHAKGPTLCALAVGVCAVRQIGRRRAALPSRAQHVTCGSPGHTGRGVSAVTWPRKSRSEDRGRAGGAWAATARAPSWGSRLRGWARAMLSRPARAIFWPEGCGSRQKGSGDRLPRPATARAAETALPVPASRGCAAVAALLLW